MVSSNNSNAVIDLLALCFSKDYAHIAAIVTAYWFVSISMVYLNKMLMSNQDISVPAPLFITWFQCVVTAAICYGAGEWGETIQDYTAVAAADTNDDTTTTTLRSSKKGKHASFWHQFPRQTFQVAKAQRVFPLSLIFIGMITFNNLCLKWVHVSFYNVARSLTICFNVFFSQVLMGSTTSTNTALCLSVVIVGFFLGCWGENDFSLQGTIAGILSSLFVSLNSIFTKKILPEVDNDHWKLTFYNNVNASLLFLPLMLLFEHQPLFDAFTKQLLSPVFWMAMSVAGIFGFFIGIVTIVQIKATSPLIHNISGTAKAAVQSMMAFYLWNNAPTVMGVLGIFIVLGGSLLYTVVKMKEGKVSTSRSDKKSETQSDHQDVEMMNRPLKSGVN